MHHLRMGLVCPLQILLLPPSTPQTLDTILIHSTSSRDKSTRDLLLPSDILIVTDSTLYPGRMVPLDASWHLVHSHSFTQISSILVDALRERLKGWYVYIIICRLEACPLLLCNAQSYPIYSSATMTSSQSPDQPEIHFPIYSDCPHPSSTPSDLFTQAQPPALPNDSRTSCP